MKQVLQVLEQHAEPIVQGTVKEVFVDPQEFDIEAVQSISLTGGNGSGCVLQPILGDRNRELLFDSRDVSLMVVLTL